MLSHLCVAFAPTPSGHATLAEAVRLARRCDARLTVINVAPPTIAVDGRLTPAEEILGLREDCRYRQRLVEAVTPWTKGVATSVRVFGGLTTPTILDVLAVVRPDLVVVGSKVRRSVARVLSAPLTDGLLAEAPCPVAVVRSRVRDPRPAVLALARDEPGKDIAWRGARALARDLRADLIQHPAPRHPLDGAGVAAAASACRAYRPLITVIQGDRMPGARRRLGLSMTAALTEALTGPLVVIPPRLRAGDAAPEPGVRHSRRAVSHGSRTSAREFRSAR